MQTIGDRIALARDAKGWDQKSLAQAIGSTPQQVSMWESGARKTPRIQALVKLASALEVRVEWLKHGTGPMEAGPLDNLTEDDFRSPKHLHAIPITTGGGKTYSPAFIDQLLLAQVIRAVLEEGTDSTPDRIALVAAEVYGTVQRTGRGDRISDLAKTLLG